MSDLSKEKLYIFVKPMCEREGLDCPKPRTIGRIIADAPGKMRSFPVKVRSNGQRVLRKKVAKARKPKGFKSAIQAIVALSIPWNGLLRDTEGM